MRDATQVEPEAVRAGESGPRRPAAGGEESEASKEGGIDLRLRVADIQLRDENARLRQRRARVQPEFPGRRPCRRPPHALPAAMDCDAGRGGPPPVPAPPPPPAP